MVGPREVFTDISASTITLRTALSAARPPFVSTTRARTAFASFESFGALEPFGTFEPLEPLEPFAFCGEYAATDWNDPNDVNDPNESNDPNGSFPARFRSRFSVGDITSS